MPIFDAQTMLALAALISSFGTLVWSLRRKA